MRRSNPHVQRLRNTLVIVLVTIAIGAPLTSLTQTDANAKTRAGTLVDPPKKPGLSLTARRGDRVVRDRSVGLQLIISDEGDCNKVNVRSTLLQQKDQQDEVLELRYSFDDRCRVHIEGVREIDHARFRRQQGYGNTRERMLREASDRSSNSPRAERLGSLAVTYGNYVHTSQTVQDVIFIDIAKLQYHTDRNWNGTCTWWRPDWWAQSSTSVRWNHPDGPPWIYYAGPTACGGSWTSVGVAANFHSDFLWCNFTAPWQRLQLAQHNYSRSDGAAGAWFWQNRACPGTHMATRLWVNIDRNG
jgi:hypothetical protein